MVGAGVNFEMQKSHFSGSGCPQGSFRYKLRTIFEEKPMPWDAPVCVNHHEAKAYCWWESEKDPNHTVCQRKANGIY